MYKNINYEVIDSVGVITLNNPDKLNALSFQILDDLDKIIAEVEADRTLRVLIIWGNEKTFGAGADLDDIINVKTVKDGYEISHKSHLIYNRIENLKIPTIAAIAGFALGGCFEFALSCDMRVASEKAKIALPEASLGLLPGGGGTQRLAKLIGTSRAKELMFFGNMINAAEAHRLGLVNRIVAVDTLYEEVMKMAQELKKMAPIALELIKASVNVGYTQDTVTAMAYEARCFGALFNTEDAQEGINAFLEKRKPNFIGK